MNVAVRVEGNRKIGLGHVNRCLSISKKLNQKKINVIFIINDKPLKKIIEEIGFQVKIIQKKTEIKQIQQIIIAEKIKIIIFDSKKKTFGPILKKISPITKIIMIDNLNYLKESNLTILPNLKEENKKYPKNFLGGLEYVLLNPEIKRMKNKKLKNTILVSAGSSDKYNITKKIVKSFLKSHSEFKMKIILGGFFRNIDEIKTIVKFDDRFEVFVNPKNLSELMNQSTLAIITFGITIFEMAFLGIPTFVISHSNENHRSALKIEKYGWFKYLGKYDKIKYQNLDSFILKYLNNDKILQKMIKKSNVIDGKGSKRISNAIIKLV